MFHLCNLQKFHRPPQKNNPRAILLRPIASACQEILTHCLINLEVHWANDSVESYWIRLDPIKQTAQVIVAL